MTGLFSCAAAEQLQSPGNPDFPPPLVEAHEPEGDEYFADAVFIGDSMMENVETSGLIPTANYISRIGMSAHSMDDRQFRVQGHSGRLNAYEYAATYQPAKVYVWIGANGLSYNTSDTIIGDYERVADDLITHFPDALIYVISPPPMTKVRMNGEKKIPAGRYAEFNEKLCRLAQRRGFYYIDMYSLVTNEEGYLRKEYAAGDGFHLSREAYVLLTDAVRSQTVPMPDTDTTRSEQP